MRGSRKASLCMDLCICVCVCVRNLGSGDEDEEEEKGGVGGVEARRGELRASTSLDLS